MQITVPTNGWRPREYQMPVWDYYLNSDIERRRGACVWHRRAGKDICAINLIAVEMLKRVGLYWHILPTYAQGEKVIWIGTDGSGNAYVDYIPKELWTKKRDDKMLIQISNGSVYQVIGGDNPSRLVGSNPVGCVFSEYSLHNPECWDLIRPILNENGGWALFIYTARGYNHGYKLLKAAQELDNWFSQVLTIDDTKREDGKPVVTDAMIEEDRKSGMPEELIKQEYYCDFSAPLVGSIFGGLLTDADNRGRINKDVIYMPDMPVYTGWDIGIGDATSIWFFQLVEGWVHWIDFVTDSGQGIDYYARELQNKNYIYKKHYGPHDLGSRDWSSGKTRVDVAADLGLRFDIIPQMNLEDQINSARLVLKRSKFNSETCAHGLEALRHYRREWDRSNRIWSSKPVHDWSSHPASALMTSCLGMPKLSRERTIKSVEDHKWEETFKEIQDRIIKNKRKEENGKYLI